MCIRDRIWSHELKVFVRTESKDLGIGDTLKSMIQNSTTNVYPNTYVVLVLRILWTMPVTVVVAELSFALMLFKHCLRLTIYQGSLSSLGILSIKSGIFSKLDFFMSLSNSVLLKTEEQSYKGPRCCTLFFHYVELLCIFHLSHVLLSLVIHYKY